MKCLCGYEGNNFRAYALMGTPAFSCPKCGTLKIDHDLNQKEWMDSQFDSMSERVKEENNDI